MGFTQAGLQLITCSTLRAQNKGQTVAGIIFTGHSCGSQVSCFGKGGGELGKKELNILAPVSLFSDNRKSKWPTGNKKEQRSLQMKMAMKMFDGSCYIFEK